MAPYPSAHQSSASFSLNAAAYPKIVFVHPGDVGSVVTRWVTFFNQALYMRNYENFGTLFFEESYWRDQLCFSWDFRTLNGPQRIRRFLERSLQPAYSSTLSIDDSDMSRQPRVVAIDPRGSIQCIQAFLDIDIAFGNGRGVVRLLQDAKDKSWKAYTLCTSLREIRHGIKLMEYRRPSGINRGLDKTWQEQRTAEENFQDERQPTVLIIGAGQCGLLCAARLRQLNISSLVVDRNKRIGDNWRNRYRTLVLHDPVWYNHLPYLPFPENWPVFTPKDKLSEWMEFYSCVMELNVWTSTQLKKVKWKETEWEVTLVRSLIDGTIQTRKFFPRHIIMATGQAGEANIPSIPGIESFDRSRICHSSQFSGARDSNGARRAVVVGSGNSAHDIAQDFYHHGYHVTMLQRSSTCVDPTRYLKGKGLYMENGPSTEDADLLTQSLPTPVMKRNEIEVTRRLNIDHNDFFDGLMKAGFKLNNGPDGAGRKLKFLESGGGYYINVGASQLIIDGHIKIVHGQEVVRFSPTGLVLTDGSELKADEIVFATGYKCMRQTARGIFGNQVASKLTEVWGLDEEGELKSVWRRSGHPGLWFAAGNLALARYYSRLLALQIQAVEEGLMR
ncbi:putative flavoprotein [Zopfia rhizophila CBS 207.26]|uniref:Putative flavoprotein n=1 Tax=Zopfia rhizophila CBS 207.26 TaxID=1314779 RepID=A0A6A6D6G4_9PEZI|nr:putative flavoprotein [Zopfia rhizophila CBS 207.26]